MRVSLPKVFALILGTALATLFFVNLMPDAEHRARRSVAHQFPVSDPQFLRSMGALLGPGMVPGNRVETLVNGDRIFPAMLDAIRGAQRTITFETYIYWSGAVGKQFADALSERARAGVKVHILIDWVGSQKMEEALLEQMKQAGCAIHKYHALHWYTLYGINNVQH